MDVDWNSGVKDIFGRITISVFSDIQCPGLIFLIMLNTTLLLVVMPVPIYAQENVKLHQKTLYEITKHSPDQNPSIKVGKQPIAIAVDPFTDTVYVANFDDNSVSAINRLNNTEISRIKLGNLPNAMFFDPDTHTLYVTNYSDNSVSVINGLNNTEISRIKVGNLPNDIGLFNNKLYVANYGDNSVSVINGLNNTEISRIKVGHRPSSIGVDQNTSRLYVANFDDKSVSKKEEESEKVVTRVTFNIDTINSNHI